MAIPSLNSSQSDLQAKTLSSPRKRDTNLTYKIQELVCMILSQVSKLADHTRQKTELLKKEYKIHSEESAKLLEKQGNAILGFALIHLGSHGLEIGSSEEVVEAFRETFTGNSSLIESLLSRAPLIHGISSITTSQIPVGKDAYLQYIGANQTRMQSKSQLENTEIGYASQNTGGEQDLSRAATETASLMRDIQKTASHG